MQQSPRSVADKLGISVSTYYLWERGRPIPPHFEYAVRFLSTQNLPKDPTLRHRPGTAFLTRFASGARFGRLVVADFVPPSPGSRHTRVEAKCDCGVVGVVRTSFLTTTSQCGRRCKLEGTPFPADPLLDPAPAPPTADSDEPDLEAPDIVWRLHNDRKAREKEALNNPTPAPAEEEWEAGL